MQNILMDENGSFSSNICVSHGAGQAETSALVAGKVARCEMLCLNFGPILEYPNSHVGAEENVREPCIDTREQTSGVSQGNMFGDRRAFWELR